MKKLLFIFIFLFFPIGIYGATSTDSFDIPEKPILKYEKLPSIDSVEKTTYKDFDEAIELRSTKSLTYKISDNKFISKIYSTDIFSKKISWLRYFIDTAYAVDDSFYSELKDGTVGYLASPVWSTSHDATTGGQAYGDASQGILACTGKWSNYEIWRGFLPFDTSSLPDDAVIDSATLYVYVYAHNDATGDGYINIVQTTQDPTDLTVNDYDAMTVDSPTLGGTQLDLADVINDQYNLIDFNATGLTWVDVDGYTKIGVREKYDIEDTPPAVTSTGNEIDIRYVNNSGTENDPYLEITYHIGEEPPAEETTTTDPILSGEQSKNLYFFGFFLFIIGFVTFWYKK